MSSLKSMRAACLAQGLPTSGTKESLKKRLAHGIGDQRRKDKSGAKKETEISVPPEFYNKERQTLLDLGMTNEVKIAEEVTRRYSVVESTKKPEPTLFSFPQPLPDETRKQTNLEFVAMSDKGEFQYKMIMPGEEEKDTPEKDTPKGSPKGSPKARAHNVGHMVLQSSGRQNVRLTPA